MVFYIIFLLNEISKTQDFSKFTGGLNKEEKTTSNTAIILQETLREKLKRLSSFKIIWLSFQALEKILKMKITLKLKVN